MEFDMGALVNLKRFKKRGEREQAARQADTNRIKFGRTKSERSLDESNARRADNHLDQRILDKHLVDGEDAS
jgi:hypothetical protein